MATPYISMAGIGKSFGPVHALKSVNLTVYHGEIHALLGENGAGKSTLMKVLSGIHEPTKGTITINQMREISRLTKETIHLGALDEDSIVYIHKIDSMYNLRMYSRIGRRNPLYSTAIGKVLLAWRDRDEVKQILEGVEYKRSTERTITSTEALLPVLDQVREQGYGEDNEEQEEGLRCIAVPVFDRFGVVIAGLSISFPTLRFSEERLQEYVAMLHTAARKISAQMGYHDYPF